MRVRLLESVVGGVDGHWSPKAGDEVEVSASAGKLLCERGVAEAVVVKVKPEKAVPAATSESRRKK